MIVLFEFLPLLVFLYDGIEFDELALMVLAVIDQFSELLAYGLNVVETGERHVAVEVGCRRTGVNGEDFHRRLALLEFDGHHTHHGVLGSLAGNVGQWVPVGTDL